MATLTSRICVCGSQPSWCSPLFRFMVLGQFFSMVLEWWSLFKFSRTKTFSVHVR